MTDLTVGYWAIVELMGHRRRAGQVKEVEQFGAKMLRIDIPAGEGFVTEFYGGSSIYALRPASEDVARRVAEGATIGSIGTFLSSRASCGTSSLRPPAPPMCA